MNAIVFEDVPVGDLPEEWRARLAPAGSLTVTVRIEQQDVLSTIPATFATDDPAFGIWRDRDDLADVAAYVRKIRQPRYGRDGSRHEP